MWEFLDTMRKPNLWIMGIEWEEFCTKGIENILNETAEESSLQSRGFLHLESSGRLDFCAVGLYL